MRTAVDAAHRAARAKFWRRAYNAFSRHRTLVVCVVYLALTAGANLLAVWLRFDGAIPRPVLALAIQMLPWLLALTTVAVVVFGLHRSVWRFTGIWDLCDLVAAVAASATAFYLIVRFRDRPEYPRSVFVIGGFLAICFIGGVRLFWRILLEARPRRPRGRRILIYGAGNAGEMIVRDLNRNLYTPIGFVDDDPAKLRQSIHRVKVLGGRDDLARIVTTEAPDEVLVAMPSAGAATIRRIVGALERFKVPITTLPPLLEIVDCKVTVSQIRRLAPEDLLPRMQVHLDMSPAGALVEGRRVLVTGAGGSIGSELCRQILGLRPERLVLYERYENNLYSVLNKLESSPRVEPALGDVTDVRRLHSVMRQFQPDVVFHAAAHKHVPLMELNPCEAVKNNVIGTRRVAEAAIQHGVERFILISTDKAVNPSSLMGATKRVAELAVKALASPHGTRMATVRFGNVLGSNGSVVPRWLEQIDAGGPVTVTHPDVRRYFMLIPEAVQLILHTAAIMHGGEIFVLQMGEQIRLLDMARHLIRLAGSVPDDDIPIVFTGLRPGEKLYEELVGPGEEIESSPLDKVLQLRTTNLLDGPALLEAVTTLGMSAIRGNAPDVLDVLCQIVPTFRPGPELSAGARNAVSFRTVRAFAPGKHRGDGSALRRLSGPSPRHPNGPAPLGGNGSAGTAATPRIAPLTFRRGE